MRTLPLGQSGIQASVVGFGAWAAGGWLWGGADANDAVAAIHAYLDGGGNLIDTAPMYGFGRSEEIVGQAIQGRRGQVVLATKCGLIWHAERGDFNFYSTHDTITGFKKDSPAPEGQPKPDHVIYRCLAPDIIRYEVEQSLRRMKVDYIDLLQTHWPETQTPRPETMACLMDLKREGKIRAIGVSNTTVPQLEEYLSVGPVDNVQERYSLLDRRHNQSLLPFAGAKNIAFLCYSPLEQGLLSGKAAGRTFQPGDQRLKNAKFQPEYLAKCEPLFKLQANLAEQYGATPGQVALAWTLAQPGVTHTLAGARNIAQAVENAGAGRLALASAEVQALTDAAAAIG